MDLGMKGKAAVVAGGSMGLGKAVAVEMAREGAHVAIGALDDAELERSREEVKKAGSGRVLAIPCDLSRPEDAEGFVLKAKEELGRVDILVNNAGGPPSVPFLDIDSDLWEKGFRLNLLSTIMMTRGVIPGMKERRWGRIINMTSISVKQPIEGLILSNTIRSGVIGLAKTLSNELAPFNITVNSVCPGYTMTERVRTLSEAIGKREGVPASEIVGRWESSIPMGRLGTVEEFAALVCFLASERAGYITGAAVQIDGGWYRGVM